MIVEILIGVLILGLLAFDITRMIIIGAFVVCAIILLAWGIGYVAIDMWHTVPEILRSFQ